MAYAFQLRMKFLGKFWYLAILVIAMSCGRSSEMYYITGDINDPKNQITLTIAELFNRELGDSLVVKRGDGSLASLDSLMKGQSHFTIVDNYIPFKDEVRAIIPLYPQILHVLHRKNYNPQGFAELLEGKKVYADAQGSGTYMFVLNLIRDFQVDLNKITFVPVEQLFSADVIFSFTDLISPDELADLSDFQFYSFDLHERLGRGSIAEAICTRYPQFRTYILPQNVYGNFTPEPVLTVSVDALLICRKELDNDLVYDVARLVHQNKQAFVSISPLLYGGISDDFDVQTLNFTLHPGARNYIERSAPTIFERYAELSGVIITIIIALVSGLFTFAKYREAKKKNKIDIYYKRLMFLRSKISNLDTTEEVDKLLSSVKSMQDETTDLVVKEKLAADESFLIFLNLSRIITEEAQDRKKGLVVS